MSLPFCLYLKKIRIEHKYSQKRLAQKLGYDSSQFISNWERGHAYPPMEALAIIVSIFKLNKTEVFNLYIEEITKKKQSEYCEALKKHS